MKFRPLRIDYYEDAASNLDEGVSVVPQIVIDPFSGVVESSESEYEGVVQPEKRTVPPRRSKAFKRTLSPLKDDASFACIKRNPLQNNANEMYRSQGESAEISLLATGDTGSENDQHWNQGKDCKRSLSPAEDDISFDYVNHDTLQNADDETDRHPQQITGEVMDSHPVHDTDDEIDPLQDTDDEFDREIDRDIGKITRRRDEGKRRKRSFLSKRTPAVKVVPSYHQFAFGQHSKLDGEVNERKSGKRFLLTTRTGEPIEDFEYAINMVEKDTLITVSVASSQPFTANDHGGVNRFKAIFSHCLVLFATLSPKSPTKKKRKSKGIQETITDTTEIDENFDVSLEQVPSVMEISVPSSLHVEESHTAVQRDSSPMARYERVISPLDPQVLSRIVQGLRYSISNKRIANVPEQKCAFYYGSTKDVRVLFWRGGPVDSFALNSSASFHDCLYGHDGIGRLLRHDQILNLSFPPTATVLGMLRYGNFRSMSRSAPTTISPTLNALVPVKPTFKVPPIWLDVVQAILYAKQTSPAIVTPAVSVGTEPLDLNEFSYSQFIESLISNKDTIPMSDNGTSLNLKRPREEAPWPDVSPKRPKELFVEGERLRNEKRKSRRGDKSSDDKMDRQERKRRKKEKKRARKERKRKTQAHDASMEDAVGALHEEIANQLNDPVHWSGVAVMSLPGDQVDNSYDHSDAHVGDGTKRQKIKHLPLGWETAKSRIDQWSIELLANPVVEMPSHHSDALSPSEAAAFVEQHTIAREGKPEAILDSKLHAEGDIGGDDTQKRGKREKKAKKTRTRKDKKVLSPSKSSHLAGREEGGALDINKQSLPSVQALVQGEVDALKVPKRSVRPTDHESFHPPPKNATRMRTAEEMVGTKQQRTRAEPPNTTTVAPRHGTKDVDPMAAKSTFVSHHDRSNSVHDSEAVHIQENDRHSNLLENNSPPLRALCSESFLEGWCEATALLASGHWMSSFQPLGTDEARAAIDDEPPRLGQRIQLFDTPLLDDAGVDIELPGHAIIVHRLSSWQTSECANVQAKGLARLTALGRYERLDVIFCADINISPALSLEIAFVQNAVVHQSRTQCHPPSFQVIAPRLLPAIVASSILGSQKAAIATDSFIYQSITDVRVQERARFLLSICPLLTVCGALGCLQMRLSGTTHDDDETRQSFQHLISNTPMAGSGKMVGTNNSAFQQLSLAFNVSFY